jgi:hypothetical protein
MSYRSDSASALGGVSIVVCYSQTGRRSPGRKSRVSTVVTMRLISGSPWRSFVSIRKVGEVGNNAGWFDVLRRADSTHETVIRLIDPEPPPVTGPALATMAIRQSQSPANMRLQPSAAGVMISRRG